MSDIEQIEISIEHAKKLAERGRQAEKLLSNREFKKLILEHYFGDEAKRLVSLTADPSQLTDERQKAILIDMQAISTFQAFIRDTIAIGQRAAAELEDYDAELEAIHDEAEEEEA